MTGLVNSHTGFSPLQEVWLGDTYPENFYDHLPNEIADAFCHITELTRQDTQNLQVFLEGRGITVRRPVFGKIDLYLDDKDNLVKPPVTPRDHYFTLGNTLYSLHNKLDHDPWQHWLTHYAQHGEHVVTDREQSINCLNPPSLVRVGRDLFLDTETHKHVWGYMCEWMVQAGKTYRMNICETGGHCDGVFCPVAPGLIVSSHYKNDYHVSFPGWEVYRVPNTLNNFKFTLQHPNWFANHPAVDVNRAFGQHIIDKARDWVGTAQETVYEVNMLVLDEHNVVAMKEYPPLFEWLHKRGITVHLFDLRTRQFWDGGWHCFTLDIRRQDSCHDYFPERGSNGVYWRLD